jgi:endonuclease YncB( thermonuclease family)
MNITRLLQGTFAPFTALTRRENVHRAMLLVTLAFSALAAGASAATIRGRVVGVTDGDTISVLDASKREYKIRLAGIDAPERSQEFGQKAKQALAALTYGREVEIYWEKQDRYRRIVGKIGVQSPHCVGANCPFVIDAGLSLIKQGLAWHFKKYAHEQSASDRIDYSSAEESAKLRKIGLWSNNTRIPPWEFRRGKSNGL